MNNKYFYKETNTLNVNAFLLFYIYVFIIIIISNVVPRFSLYYFIFLFLGIAGTIILLIKFTYTIAINKNRIEFFIKIPFKIILFKERIADIKQIEKVKSEDVIYSKILKRKNYNIYNFKKEEGIKLTTSVGKIFIVYGVNADQIIRQIMSDEINS